MKKPDALTLLILLVAICVLPLQNQQAQAAYSLDGSGFPLMGTLEVASPENSTYTTSVLMLNVSVRSMVTSIYNCKMVYSLDGAENVSLPLISEFMPVEVTRTYANGTTEKAVSQTASYYVISGESVLPELPQGLHNLTLYEICERKDSASTSWSALLLDKAFVNFTINNPQNISVETATGLEINKQTPENSNTWLVALIVGGLIAFTVLMVFKKLASKNNVVQK